MGSIHALRRVVAMKRVFRLTGRYYRTVPMSQAGYVEEPLELDADKTAFVVLHCWNIGCLDGPALDDNFWVGMGFPETTVEAYRIMREVIRPCMEAARQAGILVCHVEPADIVAKHVPTKSEAKASPSSVPPAVAGYREGILARSHGEGYAVDSPFTRKDRARVVASLPGEPFVAETKDFDAILRERGIENLIYAGFATDMCVLFSPAATMAMAGLGYRVYLMRDATLGVEFPDTFEERLATRWAIRFFETHLGDTVTSRDFLEACQRLTEI